MKENIDLKFDQYPFIVPTERRTTKKLEQLIADLKECGSEKTAYSVIKKWNKFLEEISTEIAVVNVLFTTDTTNKAYKNANNKVDELTPLIAKYATEFNAVLAKARYRKDLENRFGKYYFKLIDTSLKAFDEKIVEDKIEENKLASKYQEIIGGAQIKFKGETYNLYQLGKFLQDTDRNVRREAAQATSKWFGDHDKELGELFDKLVHLRDNMAKKLGYKNFVELGYLRLMRTDYDAKKVKNYRKQIETEVVPLCSKLYKAQAKRIEVKNPQYYDYSLFYKDGNPKPLGSTKDIVKTTQKMFADISSETKEFFDFMVSHNLLDLETRAGKAPGGYQTTFEKYKAPFIFSNFRGDMGDVNVLTHESGHAFQAYLASRNIKIPEYRTCTYESCEIHSMSMEYFAWPYMKDYFGKDEAKYRYHHLVDSIEFLPYGATIDEFQHWVYEHPNATHEERCKEYREIEKRYTPEKKYDDTPELDKGIWWEKQLHVFMDPFYYIDYTLASVVAFQFFIESRKHYSTTWNKYYKFCKCGGKYPFQELLEKNHLRNPFNEGTVAKAMSALTKVVKEFDY